MLLTARQVSLRPFPRREGEGAGRHVGTLPLFPLTTMTPPPTPLWLPPQVNPLSQVITPVKLDSTLL